MNEIDELELRRKFNLLIEDLILVFEGYVLEDDRNLTIDAIALKEKAIKLINGSWDVIE